MGILRIVGDLFRCDHRRRAIIETVEIFVRVPREVPRREAWSKARWMVADR